MEGWAGKHPSPAPVSCSLTDGGPRCGVAEEAHGAGPPTCGCVTAQRPLARATAGRSAGDAPAGQPARNRSPDAAPTGSIIRLTSSQALHCGRAPTARRRGRDGGRHYLPDGWWPLAAQGAAQQRQPAAIPGLTRSFCCSPPPWVAPRSAGPSARRMGRSSRTPCSATRMISKTWTLCTTLPALRPAIREISVAMRTLAPTGTGLRRETAR